MLIPDRDSKRRLVEARMGVTGVSDTGNNHATSRGKGLLAAVTVGFELRWPTLR